MKNKTVLVTGAATGIGRSTAELFAAMGYQVAIGCNHSFAEGLQFARALSEMGMSTMAVKADLSQPDQVDAMVPADRVGVGRCGYPHQQRRYCPAEALYRHHQ